MKQIIFDLWTNKRMVLSLAKNDFKQRFAGSYFGIMWAFVNPVVTIMLYLPLDSEIHSQTEVIRLFYG